MFEQGIEDFYSRLLSNKEAVPFGAQLELTYRCGLNCVHCYCKGLDEPDKELTLAEIKRILDELSIAGIMMLTLTGGEPFARKDFNEIYSYAKEKGFLVTIFTNAQALSDETLQCFLKSPPYLIEVTLNGLTVFTYESITKVIGSFEKAMGNIQRIIEHKLPIVIKSNLLKQNKHEVAKIKDWAEKKLGKPAHGYRFKCGPYIHPKLNGDNVPCQHRLNIDELFKFFSSDKEFFSEHCAELSRDFPPQDADGDALYYCDTSMQEFYIDPYGKLKFCPLTDKFSVDLRQKRFEASLFTLIPRQIRQARFKGTSVCRSCTFRKFCLSCPARAYLETGDEEAPADYFCNFAKQMAQRSIALQSAR